MLNIHNTRIKACIKALGLLVLPMTCWLTPLSHAEETGIDQVTFQPDPVNGPVVFISSSCSICALSQPMTIGFSADQDGMMTVLLVTPDGQQSTLFSQSVEANSIQYVTAVATAPAGKHVLIALFGEEQGDLAKTLAQLLPEQETPAPDEAAASAVENTGQKGLELVAQPIQLIPHAIREFQIVE